MYNESTKQKAAWLIVAIVLTLVSVFFGVNYPIPEPPMSPLDSEIVALGTTNFTAISAEDLTATDDVTVGDDLTVTDATTLSGDVIVDDTLNLDDTDNTSTGTANLAPTTTFYELAPTAALTLTLQTTSAEVGDLLILVNTVSTNTVIVDTGATVGGGNITLSTNDMAVFIYSNSKWLELASPDNS